MNPQNVDPRTMHAAMAVLAFMPIFALIFLAIMIIPYWMIWKKAGFSPWLSLLVVIPLVNIVMLYMLAFMDWKVAPVGPGVYPGYPRPYPGAPQGGQPGPYPRA